MSFRSTYDLATVQAFTDGKKFGEPINPARVTLLGAGDDLFAKIYARDLVDDSVDEDGNLINNQTRWMEADQVIAGKVTENSDGSLTLTGTSRHLVEKVGLRAGEAVIRYEISPRNCPGCR